MFKIKLNDSMLYFGLYVQLRRGSVVGYTTDESWTYGPKEGVEAFESITFFIRFIYAINFEHLLIYRHFRCVLLFSQQVHFSQQTRSVLFWLLSMFRLSSLLFLPHG